MKRMRRWAVNRAGLPLRRFFDPRMDRLRDQLTQMERHQGLLLERMSVLERHVWTDLETTIELVSTHARRLEAAQEDLVRLTEESAFRRRVMAHPEDITAACAEFLNYAESHRGFAAQRDLWFNPPCSVEYREGGVTLGGVNERIVEIPYVFGVAAQLPPGSHILDLGAAESTVSLALASLGHDVVALDLRPYPLAHERLTSVTDDVMTWSPPERPFDLIISLSTLEHIGLRSYGYSGDDRGGDHQVLQRLASWLSHDGKLALTAPYGSWRIDDFQRTYDDAHLQSLLQGWTILDQRVARRTDEVGWAAIEDPAAIQWTHSSPGVVMLTARPER